MKSTVTTTLAAGLSEQGNRVLVIDTDPQGHATMMLGLSPEPALYDLLVRNAPLSDAIRQSGSGVYCIPGNDETSLIPMKMSNPLLLRQMLDRLDSLFDLCIIDTSPTPNLFSAVIYYASDYVLYPTKCEALHIDGLQRAIEQKRQVDIMRTNNQIARIRTLGIIPAIYRGKTLEHREYHRALQAEYPGEVWAPVPQSIVWAEASRNQQPVFQYAPETGAASAAWNMIHTFQERIGA